MPLFADYALDAALAAINDGTRIDICQTSEPTTYTEATSTLTVGNKTGLTVGAPEDMAGGGRKVVVPAITDGTVTATATAAYWALTDVANTRLLAAGALSASQAVTSGNPFTLGAIDIGIPDAA